MDFAIPSIWTDILILVVGYSVLLITSEKVINYILGRINSDYRQKVDPATYRAGNIIGRCENLLIVTFVILQAYTALALVFTAKAIVRREDMAGENSLYFLAGTMINVTYSLLVGAVLLQLILNKW